MDDEGRVIVVSDAHFGAVPPENERAFLQFLRGIPDQADELLVNGDLFDFWFEYGSVVLREHFPLLRRLADLVESGVRVRMTGGNHDAWAGSFLRDDLGLDWLETPAVIELAGRRTFVAHGDGMAAGNRGYRVLTRLLRSRASEALFRLLHPDLGRRLVAGVSRTAAEVDAGGVPHQADALSERAASMLHERPELDLVIFGHAHRPELREIEPGRHYLNAGDWIRHCTYGVVERQEVRVKRWRGADASRPGQPPPTGISYRSSTPTDPSSGGSTFPS